MMQNLEVRRTSEGKIRRTCDLIQNNTNDLRGFTHWSTQQTSSNQEDKQFLSRCYTSKEEFVKEYKRLYCKKANSKELFVLVLTELEAAISAGNVDSLKKLCNFINYISHAEDQGTLRDYCDNANNPLKSTNLVILACKHNKVKILQYLLGSSSKVVRNLSVGLGGTAILPNSEDGTCHNAFYYAIRSGNIELLDTLINKWPGNYFAIHLGELDKILSQAYEELKVKNVSLSEEMEFFVENELINLRFFSDASGQDKNARSCLNNIMQRIELVLQNISLLKAEYSNGEKVDEKFLFIAKFIAQNIHILKRQLKSTYNKLPWEEMEFCLVSFVLSHTKRQEINLFYNATLNKSKILKYLENFAKKLQSEKDFIEGVDIGKLAYLPMLKREEVVAEMVSNFPQFGELHSDYQQIRDMHSLEKIRDSIKLAVSADPKQREGQLIITRVVITIGEHLKNTLESPKLSSTTSDLLLLSLPKNTRQIIIDLRNSLSHAYSLSMRTEIVESTDVNFYIGIQNDMKRIDNVIANILYKNKIKIMRILLKKITSGESVDEIKEVAEILSDVEFKKKEDSFNVTEHDKLENLVKELSDNIPDKTNYEKELFNKINNIINFVKSKSENVTTDYYMAFVSLKGLGIGLNENKIDRNVISGIKFYANKALENVAPKMESHNLKEIAEMSMKVFHSATSRLHNDNLDKVTRLTLEIFFILEFATSDLKWIEELREKFNEKGCFIPVYKQRQTYNITENKYNNQLAQKLSEMKSILRNNALNGKLIEELPSYKKNKKLQAVIEMLVLDVMSILGGSEKYLENNLLFIDDNTPLLTGKCLRNHLAHNNNLVDVLSSDPSVAIILNARKLISENVLKSEKKVGKLVRDDPSKLKDKYDQSFIAISNQEKMFRALKEGNLEDLKSCLKKGADINARSINLSTTLHFAARGPSLEIIKFIIDQKLDVNVKDVNGQSPLHIAAAHGRKNIVDFFLRQAAVSVDDLDNRRKTPLHIAAKNGHKNTVEILLKNNANTDAKDMGGISPLHYAVANNHLDVAKILLEKEANVDINETMGGFTSLYLAAERGHLELVNFLLRNEANVNASNDRGGIPLHIAALNGHIEVVIALILQGADVNSRVVEGCTPLHYAIENGHEEIASILLKHGADVNIVDKTYNNTPLHCAAKDGHEKIVKALLKNKANAGLVTKEGITPLHLAVWSGHLKIAAVLLDHGVSIHAKDKNNATPLHYAAERGHKGIVELLIKNGVKINNKDNNYQTPLHAAALHGRKDIIELLVKNKADVRARDNKGSTPLHAAATNGSKDIIDLLIKNDAEVDARTNDGMTPLHVASLSGHEDAVAFLIKSKAQVNTRACHGSTPLHVAIVGGHKDIVKLLIKNKAEVNVGDVVGSTPLHVAVDAGHKEIVEILLADGANINCKSKDITPLLSAIKHNYSEIVELLIENGANVNAEGGEALSIAVFAGYKDIVEILLKNKRHTNMSCPEDDTLLHLAATRGHKELVNTLITRGANVDAMSANGATPLYLAAQEGHEEVAEILIANRANVNVANVEGTPLHIAAGHGHVNVVEVLLCNGAKVNIKDKKNRTPLVLAVARGHLQVVRMLLQHEKVDMNAKGNDDWTILHVASQESNLEIVKCLVDEGSDINAKNASGSKPIHIAAREGHKDTVEFFLSKGLSINELGGKANQTLLHYAAMKGRLGVVKYLITQGADVDAKDDTGSTPMHIAAMFGYKDVIEVLLRNGAIYNAVDKFYRRPLEVTENKGVVGLLALTEKLFESVKRNSSSEVENDIRAGAFINAKNVDSATPLHYAAWKGYVEVVKILLQNKANPNAVGSKKFTPIHYAAKFSHLNIAKALLSHGALYNAVSDGGKTPSDLSVDRGVTSLFKLISDSFEKVKKGNSQVIDDLNKIKDIDTIKAVMSARNRENKTLVVAAVHSNFSKVEQLKEISQGDISTQIDKALVLVNQGNYQRALSILRTALERRKDILGPDNPGTLDIQTYVAGALYKQGSYQEALNMYEEICQKQEEMLGLNCNDSLKTRSTIALVLHRQGKDKKAFNIFEEVYQKQKETLGSNHSDTLDTQFHMAIVLERLGKHEEALNINRALFKKREKTLGVNNLHTVITQNNMAMVLASQGKYEEALKIYREVFQKKIMILGINHADTLRTLHNIAAILVNQKKYKESLETFQEVLNIQKKALQPNHPETLNTLYNMGNLFFAQGKRISALKAYRECLDQRKAVFGTGDASVLDILKKIEVINSTFKLEGSGVSEILQHLQNDINIAASKGDIQTVQRLLRDGADANDADVDGRTPMHYAVSSGHIDVVNTLLNNGANVAQVTNKGNTPLHTATSRCYKEIVEILLQHVSRDKLNDFVNAKTTSSGTTALHVAAKGGSLEVVKSLLKHGATYQIENKEGKIPFDLSKDQKVTNLLKLIEELFRDIKNGNVEAITKLRAVKPDEFSAVTNARNNQGNTLLQVAIANKHKNIAGKLLEMLKKPDQNLQHANIENGVKRLNL